MPAKLRVVIERTTWRRWSYLVMGGALLLPYWIVCMFTVPTLSGEHTSALGTFLTGLAVLVLPIPMTFVTGLVPAVRVLEGTAVKELVGGLAPGQPVAPARSWTARFRTACWFCMHLHVGVVVSAFSLLVPPLAIILVALPFLNLKQEDGLFFELIEGWTKWLGPVLGVVLAVGLMAGIVLAGLVLARLAPRFLGPTAAERLAELEVRAVRLAERNRLARELHDSVGHALSVVTLQAAAAGRVLDADPDFAKQALGAIEESARSALEDLDHVLGLLREDAKAQDKAPQASLADLERLLEQSRMAGVELDAQVDGALDQIPAVVSREAYRIVQEGLTNALRYAGKVPVTLRITVRGDRLEVEMTNPLDGERGMRRGGGGGRGLRGIRERVTVLRGTMTAGPDDKRWRIDVSLPLRSVS